MKKKGFTLIELLAVILILGIIALIAIPVVSKLVANAKKGATEASAKEYIREIENKMIIAQMNGQVFLANGTYSLPIEGVFLDGDMPDSGWIEIENGEVKNCMLIYGSYYAQIEDGIVKSYKTELINSDWEIEEDIGIQELVYTKGEGNTSTSKEIGDIITIGTESFYIFGFETVNGEERVKALAKYNLLVGNKCTINAPVVCVKISDYTNKQDPTALAGDLGLESSTDPYPFVGTVPFSEESYWLGERNSYKSPYSSNNIYDENCVFKEYMDRYERYLRRMGVNLKEFRLMQFSELNALDCGNRTPYCSNTTPSWVYNTTFWINSSSGEYVWWLRSAATYGASGMVCSHPNTDIYAGVRPVIVIAASDLN